MTVLYCGYCGKNLTELGCTSEGKVLEHMIKCRGVFGESGKREG